MTKPQTDVASLELCKELYELSGWRADVDTPTSSWTDENDNWICPKYPLGYLLRKLPAHIDRHDKRWRKLLLQEDLNRWSVGYARATNQLDWLRGSGVADNPTDAACKLAIELIKQGVLK